MLSVSYHARAMIMEENYNILKGYIHPSHIFDSVLEIISFSFVERLFKKLDVDSDFGTLPNLVICNAK